MVKAHLPISFLLSVETARQYWESASPVSNTTAADPPPARAPIIWSCRNKPHKPPPSPSKHPANNDSPLPRWSPRSCWDTQSRASNKTVSPRFPFLSPPFPVSEGICQRDISWCSLSQMRSRNAWTALQRANLHSLRSSRLRLHCRGALSRGSRTLGVEGEVACKGKG